MLSALGQGYASDSTDADFMEALREADLSLLHSTCDGEGEGADAPQDPEQEDRLAQLWRCTVAAARAPPLPTITPSTTAIVSFGPQTPPSPPLTPCRATSSRSSAPSTPASPTR